MFYLNHEVVSTLFQIVTCEFIFNNSSSIFDAEKAIMPHLYTHFDAVHDDAGENGYNTATYHDALLPSHYQCTSTT